MATKKKSAKTFKKTARTTKKTVSGANIAETSNQQIAVLAAVFIILTLLLIILA